ncbi:MAG: phospholipase D-like domain-containing protein [Acidihalobacter sp.]
MLYVEPHAGVQPVVQLIRSARRSVDINAYLIDDRRILDAIRGDTRRGVRVRVVLPSRPYRVNAATVQHEFDALASTGAEIRWAPARFEHRFAYDHAKYIVGGEQAILKVLDQPGAVDLESEEFGFVPRISNALERKGRLANIIVPRTISHYDLGNLAPLRRDGVNVRFIRHPRMHAKMTVGDRLAFIGSQNISWTSLNHNREIGIILHGQAIDTLRAQFNRDWRKASPIT